MTDSIVLVLLDYEKNKNSVFNVFPNEIMHYILYDHIVKKEQIILLSKDNKNFKISKSVACTSTRICDMIDLGYYEDGSGISTNVKGDTLSKIIEYMKYESKHPTKLNTESGELYLKTIRNWDINFFKMSKRELFNLLKGSDYLEIQVLTESLCKIIASMMIGLTPKELSKEFDVPKTLKPNDEKNGYRDGDEYGYGDGDGDEYGYGGYGYGKHH